MPFDEKGVFTKVLVPHPVGGESLTKQADAKAADINNIVRGFVPLYEPSLIWPESDYSTIGSYQELVERMRAYEEAFWHLPPDVRMYCQNDPGTFLEAVGDPQSLEEMRKLGLKVEQTPEWVDTETGEVTPGDTAPEEPST